MHEHLLAAGGPVAAQARDILQRAAFAAQSGVGVFRRVIGAFKEVLPCGLGLTITRLAQEIARPRTHVKNSDHERWHRIIWAIRKMRIRKTESIASYFALLINLGYGFGSADGFAIDDVDFPNELAWDGDRASEVFGERGTWSIVNDVPEPGTLALLGLGLAGLGLSRRGKAH